MPKGSPLDKSLVDRLDPFIKLMPKNVKDQIKVLEEAERFFTVPARVDGKYVVIVGIVLKKKVDAKLSIDKDDLKYLIEVTNKVRMYLSEDVSEQGEGSEV